MKAKAEVHSDSFDQFGLSEPLLKAIANEGGVPGRDIGAIDIHDRFTLVALPEEYVEEVLRRMKGSRIRNYNANIRVAAERGRDGEPRARSAKKTGRPRAKAA